jgi:hypothetical protein
MRLFALILAVFPPVTAVQAAEWQVLDGASITAALEGRRLEYSSGAWQEFRASGRTLYNAGRDSWGYWAVRGAAYCSSWPPSDLWECYAVEGSSGGVRFIGASGDATEGRYVP